MTHDIFRDLLPLYVVGALDGEELYEIERYIAENRTQCEPEIAEFQDVADQIAVAAPPVQPSRAVLHRVMAEIEEDAAPRPRPVVVEAARDRFDFAALLFRWVPWTAIAVLIVMLTVTIKQMRGLTDKYASGRQDSVSQQQRITELVQQNKQQADRIAGQDNTVADLKTRLSSLSKDSLEQAAQLRAANKQQQQDVDALKAANGRLTAEKDILLRTTNELRLQLETQRTQVASLTKQIGEQGDALGRGNQQIAALEARITEKADALSLLTDPAIQITPLANPDPKKKSPAVGHMYWHSGRKEGWIVVSNLDPVPKGSGKSLELWVICGKEPAIAARVFWTDETGSGAFPVKLTGDVACVDKFAVTVEPTDEAPLPVPTGPMVLLSK